MSVFGDVLERVVFVAFTTVFYAVQLVYMCVYTVLRLSFRLIPDPYAIEEEIYFDPYANVVVGTRYNKRNVAQVWGPHLLQRYDSPLYTGHIGSIMGYKRPYRHNKYTRTTVIAADGCTLCLDWAYCTSPFPLGVLFIVPGLASYSGTDYVEHFVAIAVQKFHVCVANTRGMGDTPLDSPKLMSAGFTDDIRDILRSDFSKSVLAERFRNNLPVFGLGFSIGGNILAKYLAEQSQRGEEIPLTAAIACCAPYDLVATLLHMMREPQHTLYQSHFLEGLREYTQRHKSTIMRMPIDHDVLYNEVATKKAIRTVQDFERHVVMSQHGYDDAEEYYKDSSSFLRLPHVQVPLLCISALDDPCIGSPPSVRRWQALVNKNPNISFVGTPSGGHLGYLQNPWHELIDRPNVLEQAIFGSFEYYALTHISNK